MDTVRKAVAGAVVGFGAAFAQAVADGDFTRSEGWIVAGATVLGFTVVYGAPKNVERW
jgi:hypothetical protein